MRKNVIIFGADMSSSVHIDNKNKDILILVEGSTDDITLDDTTLAAEARYPIYSTQSGKRFVLSLHYNGNNSLLFVNSTKTYQFKAKNFEIKNYTLCLDNNSKYFSVNHMKKKTGLKEKVKFLSVDFNPVDTNDISDIQKYLIKKTYNKTMFGLINNIY